MTSKGQPYKAHVHPLVLLSIVDHFNRVNLKSRNKRVVGALLGEVNDGVVEISNSYAVPFEEDLSEDHVWFLDHLYHETMFAMFKKINSKERFIGWYSTGSEFTPHDIEINDVFRKYCSAPVFLMVDVEHNDQVNLPTQAYVTLEEVSKDGAIYKSFFHIESSVQAYEPEEIGVEHLLREIKEISLNTIDSNIAAKLQSLKGLAKKVGEIRGYLVAVREKRLPPNDKIMFLLQEIINKLPNLNSEELIKAYSAKNNDIMFALHLCAMTRSVLALHTLLFIGKKDQEKKKEDEKKKEEPATNNNNKKEEVKNDKK